MKQLGVMEGNDIKTNLAYSRATSLSSLPKVSVNKTDTEQAPSSGVSAKAGSALAGSEALITSITNQADSFKSYVRSLGGIISQGLNETSAVRQAALQKEANQVFAAIQNKAASVKKSEPVTTDPVRSEVEAKLGRALEILFPEKAQENPVEISFSNKELIISIQTRILKASKYLDSLSAEESSPLPEEISDVLARAETAQVNAESAQSSVRDVESAFELVKNTGSLIGSEPHKALSAIGDVRGQINLRG